MVKLLVGALIGLALFLAVSGKPFDDSEPIATEDPLKTATPDANPTPEKDEQEEDTQPEEEAEEVDTKKVVQGPRNSAERVAEWEAEENKDLFEGDIILTKKQETALKESIKSDKKETITGLSKRKHIGKKWANARVPYEIHRSFGKSQQTNLDAAIAEFNKKTCVRFVPKKSSDRSWVEFSRARYGCSSLIGNVNLRGQPINIGEGCNYVGTFIHEMMHAIGFFHEQSRQDRDDHVEIIKDNLDTRKYGPKIFERNFAKYKAGEADSLGEAYDLGSVMHYSNTAFGKTDSHGNEMVTIRALTNPSRKLGQRNGFSESDLKQINMLYNCKKFL